MSENWSTFFRSYCKKVFLAFFFFLGCALVVAHRIVWYVVDANRGISDLEGAIDDVVNLLKGAISDRACAIEAVWLLMAFAFISRFPSATRKSQDAASYLGSYAIEHRLPKPLILNTNLQHLLTISRNQTFWIILFLILYPRDCPFGLGSVVIRSVYFIAYHGMKDTFIDSSHRNHNRAGGRGTNHLMTSSQETDKSPYICCVSCCLTRSC